MAACWPSCARRRPWPRSSTRAPSLAAINAPARCVASGPAASIEALEQRLVADGVDVRRLPISHAAHSAMMDPMVGPAARTSWRARPRGHARHPHDQHGHRRVGAGRAGLRTRVLGPTRSRHRALLRRRRPAARAPRPHRHRGRARAVARVLRPPAARGLARPDGARLAASPGPGHRRPRRSSFEAWARPGRPGRGRRLAVGPRADAAAHRTADLSLRA